MTHPANRPGKVLETIRLREGTTDATTVTLTFRLLSTLSKVFKVSSLVGRRETRPSRSRPEKAIFVNELLMSTRMNSAVGIKRESLWVLRVNWRVASSSSRLRRLRRLSRSLTTAGPLNACLNRCARTALRRLLRRELNLRRRPARTA